MIECVPADLDDVVYVVDNLWPRGWSEAANQGFNRADFLNEEIRLYLETKEQHRFVMKRDGIPVAVFGAIDRENKNEYFTWFAATSDFETVGKSGSRKLLQILQKGIEEHPGCKIDIHSMCPHPLVDKWFNFLGFSLEEIDGLYKKFVYTGRKKFVNTVDNSDARCETL